MTIKTSQEKSRLKYFLWRMVQKYQPNCYLCKEPFKLADVLPSRGTDNLTEHHLDGDHSNMRLDNTVLTHRRCHKSLHVKDNINKSINSPLREVSHEVRDKIRRW